VDAGISAATEAEAREIGALWMWILERGSPEWWGGTEVKNLGGKRRTAVVTRHHGKTGSTSDVFTFSFDEGGRLTGVTYVEQFH